MARVVGIREWMVVAMVMVSGAATARADEFLARSFEGRGGRLSYRLSRPPNEETGRRYPLLVFLHGAGERGTDNRRQLTHAEKLVAAGERRRIHPCFVVAPQCPPDRRWVEVDWSAPSHDMPAEPSVPLGLVLELVERLATDLPVDDERLYWVGLSMGAFGVWDVVQRRPDLVTAAVPVCGGGDPALAGRLTDVPLWVFHGDEDTTVPTSRSRAMVQAIGMAGGEPVYTELAGVGHDAWTPAFARDDLLDWLFAQRRQNRTWKDR